MPTRDWIISGMVALFLAVGGSLKAATPVIRWSFDSVATNSGSGGSAYDAVLSGGPVYTNGPVGSAALDLDGVDDKVSVNYTLPNQGSIALWYYPEPWYNYQSVFDNSIGGNDWEMWIDGGGTLSARVGASNAGRVNYDLNNLNSSNHWYHIVYCWDKNAGITRLYVNGKERATNTFTTGWVNPGATFYLGGGNAANNRGNGAYDDVRLFDAVLTSNDVQELFGQVLAVQFKFDGTAEDVAPGRDNPATLFGASNYVAGVDGQALELRQTATREYARVDHKLPEQQGSIALWYYWPIQSNTYDSVYDNSANDNYWEAWTETSGSLNARVSSLNGHLFYSLNNLGGPNDWYHMVYTWNRAESVVRLFVNGVERSSGTVTNWVDPGRYFYLGGGFGSNTNRNGRWDDVRIYNRALTAAEVQSSFNEYKFEVVKLPLDGHAVDQAGGDHSATLSGGPQYVTGVWELALDGDGTDDNAAINYTPTNCGTIAFWYYAEPWYNYQALFDNSSNPDDWEMWIYNDGRLRFRVDEGIGDVVYDLDNLGGPKHWYHIALSWNRNGSAKLYVNGVLRMSDEIGAGWVNPGTTIYLGGHAGNTFGNGAWDDVHIYNYVLSASEISALAVRPPAKGMLILFK